MIPAGKMDKTFTILNPVETPQTNGEIVTTFNAGSTFAGMLVPRKGVEPYDLDGQTFRTEQQFQVITFYRSDLTVKHRLRESGVDYDIVFPRDPSGRQEYTLVDVVKRA